MKDAYGRDVNEARIYTTGFAGYADVDEANMITKEQLGGTETELPPAWRFFGLRTTDGAPETEVESSDAIEFLEEGFMLAGDATEQFTMTIAQKNDEIRELLRGQKPDVNGVIEVKTASPNAQKLLLLESMYRGGQIDRKLGVATLVSYQENKDERGTVTGVTMTWRWTKHQLLDNSLYWEALIKEGADPVVDEGEEPAA